MSSEENHEFRPERSENILSDDYEFVDRPEITPADSSTDDEEKQDLQRSQTGRSTIERRFEPIIIGDREELHRIATEFGGSSPVSRAPTNATSRLERNDTLAGVNIGDSVLDPSSPDFDIYKWTRMFVTPRSCTLFSIAITDCW